MLSLRLGQYDDYCDFLFPFSRRWSVLFLPPMQGITYSVMSASWDPDREGGALGVDEFKTNVANIQDGLKRSRENAILREKVSGLSEGELEKAFGDLDRKEAKKQTLENKIQEELD